MNNAEEIAFLKDKLAEQKKINDQNELLFDEILPASGIIEKAKNETPHLVLTKHNKPFSAFIDKKIKLPHIIDKTTAPFFYQNKNELENLSLNKTLKVFHSSWHQNGKTYDLTFKKLNNDRIFFSINESDATNSPGKQDIKSKKETTSENQLKINESRFKSIFQDAPIAIILVDQSVKPILCNAQFSSMTGFSIEEILCMGLKDFTHPDDYKNNVNLYQRLFNNEISNFTLTKRYITKNKDHIWVKVTVSGISNNNKSPESAIVMVQDISAEKKATTELIKSEYKYRTLIENANDGIGLFDENFKPILYNTSLYEALGFNINAYLKIDHSKYELFHPDDAKDAKKSFEDVKKGIRSRIEKRLRHSNGQYRYFSISYIPVIHENKPAALIFRRDISKRKAAEEQNEEYRLFLETLMDNLPVSLFAKTTPDFRYLYWNKTIEKLTGIEAEDAIGRTDFELNQFKKEAKLYNEEDKKLLQNPQKLENEYSFTNTLGESKQFRTIKTIHKPSVGNPMILGISMDVTQLREAENMVEQSHHIIKEAQKIAKLGYWEYDVQKDLIFDNIENRQILGTQKLTYFLNFKQFIELIHDSDKDNTIQNFKDCIKNKTDGEGIVKVFAKDKLKHLSVNYKPILDDNGEVAKVRGTTIDITTIRSSEIALKESEYKLKQAEHIAKVGYWNYDYEKNETQFSDEIWNLLDLKDQKKPINFIDFFSNVHPDDKSIVNLHYIKQKNKKQPFDFDFRIVSSQNKIKYIKAKGAFVINKLKKPVRTIGTFQDITILKEKEIALEHSASHLIEVQKHSKTGYIEIQLDENKTVFSDTIWDILEIPKGTLKEHNEFNNYISETDKKLSRDIVQKTIDSGVSNNIQYQIVLKGGKIKYINEICIVGEHKNPTHKYATRIVQDITQIKEQNLALKKSLSTLNFIKKTDELGSWEYNINNKEFFVSSELQSLLKINANNNPISYHKVIELIHPEDQFSVKKILTQSLNNKENYTLTYRIIDAANKEVKHIRDHGHFEKNIKGEWIVKSIIKNVTNIKNTEIELLESQDLLKSFAENSIIATSIFSKGKFIYSNKKWNDLMGLTSKEIDPLLSLDEIIDEISIEKLKSLFTKWDNFKIKEYTNTIEITPIHADAFNAEIFIKEIHIKGKRSFLIMAYNLLNA